MHCVSFSTVFPKSCAACSFRLLVMNVCVSVTASVQLQTVLFGGKVTTLIVRLQHKSRSVINAPARSISCRGLPSQLPYPAERSDSALQTLPVPKASRQKSGEQRHRNTMDGKGLSERHEEGVKKESGDRGTGFLGSSDVAVKRHQGNAEGSNNRRSISEKENGVVSGEASKVSNGEEGGGMRTANEEQCPDSSFSDGEELEEASLWPRLETFLLSIRYRFLQIEKLRAARQRQEGARRGLLAAFSKETMTGLDDLLKAGAGPENNWRGLPSPYGVNPGACIEAEEEDKPLLYQVPLLMPVQKFPVDVKVLAPRTGRVSTAVVVALLFSNCSAVGVLRISLRKV